MLTQPLSPQPLHHRHHHHHHHHNILEKKHACCCLKKANHRKCNCIVSLKITAALVATTPTVQYLHIVIFAARWILEVKIGEGECDAVGVWHTDDVNTIQSVRVVVGEVGGLYDARQWHQRCATCWEVMTHKINAHATRGKSLNDFKFDTSIGRSSSDGAASTAVKGLIDSR